MEHSKEPKIIVYTALIADEELPLSEVGEFFPFIHDKEDVEYIAFTNRKDLTSDFWDVQYLDMPEYISPRLFARYIKWRPGEYLPEHDFNIWMDSQCYFTIPPKDIIDNYLGDKYDIAIHHHTDLTSVYIEGAVCAYLYNHDSPERINRELELFKHVGMPFNYDHYETGILIRRHPETRYLNEQVMQWVRDYSLRDQIAVPFVVWSERNSEDTTMHTRILTIPESFTAHKGSLGLPKSKVFFTRPKPPLKENLLER